MEKQPDLSRWTYTTGGGRNNILSPVKLEVQCPLDNGRHDMTIPAQYAAGQLDLLPAELIVQVLLLLDVPSLTRFRSVNRRAMQLVDSIPEYAAIVQHCPNILRAVVSLEADAFDCATLYQTLSTRRCAKCPNFGDNLYLIDCHRVCDACFGRWWNYLPFTMDLESRYFTADGADTDMADAARRHLQAANIPSILSLPRQYRVPTPGKRRERIRKRYRLFDRQAVVRSAMGVCPPDRERDINRTLLYMVRMMAPYLFDGGQQADWGCYCLGCRDEAADAWRSPRIKYTRQGILEHFAKYGPVEEIPQKPGYFRHANPSKEAI